MDIKIFLIFTFIYSLQHYKELNMKLIVKLTLILSISFSFIYSLNVKVLARDLNLQAGTKASIQWKRVFSSSRHMRRYNIDTLDQKTRDILESYLIQHAADSDQPIVPGL